MKEITTITYYATGLKSPGLFDNNIFTREEGEGILARLLDEDWTIAGVGGATMTDGSPIVMVVLCKG